MLPLRSLSMSTTFGECDLCWCDAEPWLVITHEPDCIYNGPQDECVQCAGYLDPNDKQANERICAYCTQDAEREAELELGVDTAHAVQRTTATSQGKLDLPALPSSTLPAHDWKWVRQSCGHVQDAYELSDGTCVHLSAHYDRAERTQTPTLAVYLDGAWKPDCVAYHIGWQDYGLPNLKDDDVLKVARAALAEARGGGMVEIGCLGAHGRTGTFVAILDCLSMDRASAELAIARVRKRHCHKAIETDEQEWYVRKLAAIINGEDIPAMPVRKPVVKAIEKKTETKGGKSKKKK